MSILQIKKKGFTLAEVLIVCSVFAVMVIGIIIGINRAHFYMNNIRLQVIATNLAREGVEMMYNIRDTNRRKYSGKRDEEFSYHHWGNTPYYILSGNSENSLELLFVHDYGYCEFFKTGDDEASKFFEYLERNANGCNVNLNRTKVVLTGEYTYYSGGNIVTGDNADLLEGLADYYRIVRIYGEFCKNSNNSDDGGSCLKSDPREVRFCVKVFYKASGKPHLSELCSIMTNFMK